MNMIYLILLIICFFPGCRRYYEWGKKFFIQVDKRSIELCHARSYHGSVHIYHGFETVGMFDILWISDEVSDWYYDQIQKRYALSDEALDAIKKDDEHNRTNFVTFYLLMTEPNDVTFFPQVGVDVTSEWSTVLGVNGDEYRAQEVKEVDLVPEYKELFCEYQSPYQLIEESHIRYRNIHRVRFNRYDEDKQDLLADGNDLKFILRSTRYEIVFAWNPETCKWVITHKPRDKNANGENQYCS